MPWCPICKNEYVKGYTRCSDCNAELVESLDDAQKPIIFGEEESVKDIAGFLQANGIKDATVRRDEKEKTFELYVPDEDTERAKKLIMELMRQQAEAAKEMQKNQELVDTSENDGEEDSKPSNRRKVGAYEDKNVKAEEYRSSAFALLFIGVLGVIFLVLFWLDMLPFNMNGNGKLLFTGVMGFMFVAFIIMGFNSIKMYKSYLGVASSENSLIDEVNKYLDSMSGKEVDMTLQIGEEDAAAENASVQLYFVRMEYLKRQLFSQFPDLDIPLAEKLADDWYNKQYD